MLVKGLKSLEDLPCGVLEFHLKNVAQNGDVVQIELNPGQVMIVPALQEKCDVVTEQQSARAKELK